MDGNNNWLVVGAQVSVISRTTSNEAHYEASVLCLNKDGTCKIRYTDNGEEEDAVDVPSRVCERLWYDVDSRVLVLFQRRYYDCKVLRISRDRQRLTVRYEENGYAEEDVDVATRIRPLRYGDEPFHSLHSRADFRETQAHLRENCQANKPQMKNIDKVKRLPQGGEIDAATSRSDQKCKERSKPSVPKKTESKEDQQSKKAQTLESELPQPRPQVKSGDLPHCPTKNVSDKHSQVREEHAHRRKVGFKHINSELRRRPRRQLRDADAHAAQGHKRRAAKNENAQFDSNKEGKEANPKENVKQASNANNMKMGDTITHACTGKPQLKAEHGPAGPQNVARNKTRPSNSRSSRLMEQPPSTEHSPSKLGRSEQIPMSEMLGGSNLHDIDLEVKRDHASSGNHPCVSQHEQRQPKAQKGTAKKGPGQEKARSSQSKDSSAEQRSKNDQVHLRIHYCDDDQVSTHLLELEAYWLQRPCSALKRVFLRR